MKSVRGTRSGVSWSTCKDEGWVRSRYPLLPIRQLSHRFHDSNIPRPQPKTETMRTTCATSAFARLKKAKLGSAWVRIAITYSTQIACCLGSIGTIRAQFAERHSRVSPSSPWTSSAIVTIRLAWLTWSMECPHRPVRQLQGSPSGRPRQQQLQRWVLPSRLAPTRLHTAQQQKIHEQQQEEQQEGQGHEQEIQRPQHQV